MHLPLISLLATLAVFASTPASFAQVPQAVKLQGQLTDPQGIPYVDPVDLVLGVWGDATATNPGALLYEEEHLGVVLAPGGVFSVELGRGTPITGGFGTGLFAKELFVEVTADGETLAPRMDLASVPYAFLAEDAHSLGGVPASDWQSRVTGQCADGSYVVSVRQDGAVVCKPGSAGGGTATNAPLIGDGSSGAPLAIQAGGITAQHIAVGAVDGSRIANFSVGQSDIGIGAVQSPHIADGSVTSSDIANESILSTDIQVGAVRTSEILDGNVLNADLGTSSVTASKIAANAVGSSEIAASAVGVSELRSGAVTNSKLGLGIYNYSWTASNNSASYQGNLGSHNFCAVTGVVAGSPVSGTSIKHIVCATYPSSSNPSVWLIESHGTVSTTCSVRCF